MLKGYTMMTSTTRLGDFLKFLATNFASKVVQISEKLFGLFAKHHILSKNCLLYIFWNFWGNWATFNSTIWSHWRWHYKDKFSTAALFIFVLCLVLCYNQILAERHFLIDLEWEQNTQILLRVLVLNFYTFWHLQFIFFRAMHLGGSHHTAQVKFLKILA